MLTIQHHHDQHQPAQVLALLFNAAAECLSIARFTWDHDPVLASSMTARARELIDMATRFETSVLPHGETDLIV
jgi:hypothetical protein